MPSGNNEPRPSGEWQGELETGKVALSLFEKSVRRPSENGMWGLSDKDKKSLLYEMLEGRRNVVHTGRLEFGKRDGLLRVFDSFARFPVLTYRKTQDNRLKADESDLERIQCHRSLFDTTDGTLKVHDLCTGNVLLQFSVAQGGEIDSVKTEQTPAAKTMVPSPDGNGIYWSDRNEDHWVTGMKVAHWPTAVNQKLVVEFVLRNDFPEAREIDVSMNSGDKTSLSLGEGNKADVELKGARRDKKTAASNGVLEFEHGKSEISFAGLESGEYTLRFDYVFALPVKGDENTRRGIPFKLSLPVKFDPSYASLPIHWGKPVAGLRLGAMFQGADPGQVTRFKLNDQAAVQLFVQNVSPKAVECGFDPPYHPGDWTLNVTDRNGERIDGQKNLLHFGILMPPDPFFGRLAPGEIQPISGELPDFHRENEAEGHTSQVEHAQFTIVQDKPEELRAVPPYDYILPAGEYSARISARLRKTDSPDVAFTVDSAGIPFHVAAAQAK